jgi:hypothetical protein
VKVLIEVDVSRERLLARVVGKDIAYEAPNRVALSKDNGTERIAAIGDDADDVQSDRVVEGVAVDSFDPVIAAGVVSYLGMHLWERLHPGWRGPLGMLDSVEVRVSIEGYDAVPSALRREFIKTLPYNPNMTWWVGGEEDRY